MKNKWSMYFRMILSVSIIFFLLYYIKIDRVYLLFKMTKWKWFIILVGLVTVDRMFMAYKYSLLLKVKGIHYPFWRVVKLYYVGTFIGLFLPTTVGGDVVRVYGLSKGNGHVADLLSSVAVERLLGFLASLITAVISMVLFVRFFGFNHDVVRVVVYIAAIFLSLVLLSFLKNFWKGLIDRLPRFIGSMSLFKKLEKVYGSYVTYGRHRRVLVVFLLYSVVEQIFPVFGNYVSAKALGIQIPLLFFILVMPIVQLISRMPISFNGIGINEGLLVYFFSLLGLSSADGFSVGLMGHFAVIIATLPGLFIYLYGRDYRRVVVE